MTYLGDRSVVIEEVTFFNYAGKPVHIRRVEPVAVTSAMRLDIDLKLEESEYLRLFML